jgi:glycosyltransferase involved in cell wall biosynthesis
MRHIYFDVTFTRTQNSNVGITRTVKRLLEEIERLAPPHGMVCVPVAYHTTGFRSLPASAGASQPASPPREALTVRQRILFWIANGPIRDVVSRHFPLPLRWLAWLAYSWWDFNRLAAKLPLVDFEPGDVLFLCDASWNYPVWRAALQARRRGVRVVTVVYDLIPLLQPEFVPRLTTMAFRKWLRLVLPCSDGVLCISRSVEEDLRLHASQRGIALPSTTNFRLGCDPVQGSGSPDSIREEIRRFLSRAPCFAAIGSIEPRKNYGFVLDAFEELWRSGTDTQLLVMGRRTPQSVDLLRRMDSHPELGKRLLVIDDGTDEEIAFAYTGSRALLFASLAEGFGLPLVEARARGCAVVASDLPAFAELADEGVSLFPAGSASALKDLVLLHLQRSRRASVAVPFTWTDTAQQCLTFIDGLRPQRPIR